MAAFGPWVSPQRKEPVMQQRNIKPEKAGPEEGGPEEGGLPFVSVIVPHLNDHARLRLCLRALEAQDYPPDRREVIVVDNGSDEPLDAIAAEFPHVRLADEPERGCGLARNRGLTLARGEVIAFTDSDCLPDKGWIRNAQQAVAGERGADIAGGDIRLFAEDEDNPTGPELFEQLFTFRQEEFVHRDHFAAGASLITRRDVCDQVGPFLDVNYPEDKEWGRRAHRMGYRLAYVPQAITWHPAKHDWNALAKKWDLAVRHLLFLYSLGPSWRLRWAIRAAAVAVSPLPHTLRVLRSPKPRTAAQRLWTLAVLYRIRWYRTRKMLAMLIDPPEPTGPG